MYQNNLKKILQEKGISQLSLYKMTGISPAAISTITNGWQIPYPGWRSKISNALNVPESTIFPEEHQ